MSHQTNVRLTQFAAGGGCACKIPPGVLEGVLASAGMSHADGDLLVGLESGDDAAVVRVDGDRALVATADFFTPVVDDAYDFGRIAAANALSDVYAMGGEPMVALSLLAWPRDRIPIEVAGEVLRGAADVCATAATYLAGGHSIDDPEPKYGLAVTGLADPTKLMRNSTGVAGLPLTLTKPLGVGVLNNLHKKSGASIPHAIESMITLNRDASRAAVEAGCTAATDVTGFGLLGHLFKLARASGVSAVIDADAVPYLDEAREAAGRGYISGGTKRNLEWVRSELDSPLPDIELLLLADAQTSGGLLVVGEVPGYPIIGELVPRSGSVLAAR